MKPLALDLDGVERRYGERVALAGVTVRLEAGRTLAVLGSNGAGKTTLLRVLATLLRPHGGVARVLGHDIEQAEQDLDERRLAGAVGAHQAGHALADLDREVGQRVDRPVVLGQAGGRDHRLVHGRLPDEFPRHVRHAIGRDRSRASGIAPRRVEVSWRSRPAPTCGGSVIQTPTHGSGFV